MDGNTNGKSSTVPNVESKKVLNVKIPKKTRKAKKPPKKVYVVKCPICNTPRSKVENHNDNTPYKRKRNVCMSQSCVRETYNSSSVPTYIRENSVLNQHYYEKFGAIASGIVYLGIIQCCYNIRLKETMETKGISNEILEILEKIHANQSHTYKVAISFGRFLERLPDSTDEDSPKPYELEYENVFYFHSSSNNASMLYSDKHRENFTLIHDDSSFNHLCTELEDKVSEDIKRPNSKYRLLANVNVGITLLRPNIEIMTN